MFCGPVGPGVLVGYGCRVWGDVLPGGVKREALGLPVLLKVWGAVSGAGCFCFCFVSSLITCGRRCPCRVGGGGVGGGCVAVCVGQCLGMATPRACGEVTGCRVCQPWGPGVCISLFCFPSVYGVPPGRGRAGRCAVCAGGGCWSTRSGEARPKRLRPGLALATPVGRSLGQYRSWCHVLRSRG